MAEEILNNETSEQQTTTQESSEQSATQEVKFDIENLNTFLEIPEEKKFKSAEDFKSRYADMTGRYDQFKDLERVKKELKESQDAYNTHLQETEELFKEANPEKIFGSKEAYKNYLVKQEILKDGMRNSEIVDAILRDDLSTYDELELVYHQKMLNTPGLSADEAIYDIIFNDLNKKEEDLKDDDGNDLPIDSKADLFKILKPHEIGKLKALATSAKKELMSLKNTEVPADDNYFTKFTAKQAAEKQAKEDKINSLKESWKPMYDSFKDIKSVQLTEKDKEGNENVIFDFPIDSGVLSKIDKNVEDYVIANGIEPNEENLQVVREAFIDGYASKNWKKLVLAAITQSAQKVTEQNISERENRQPMNSRMNTEQPTTDVAKINEERLRKAGII